MYTHLVRPFDRNGVHIRVRGRRVEHAPLHAVFVCERDIHAT